MNTFAGMLRYLRERDGLTQSQLAQNIGVSRSRIGMYETGEREPDIAMLETLSDYFNVDMNFLLGKQNKENPQPEAEGEISVDERVEQLMSGLSDSKSATFMLDGEPASPEALESLRGALKQAVETARAVNKARRKDK